MIIEYLRQSNPGGADERPSFTVDTADKDVELQLPAGLGFLRNGTGYRYFQANDNYRLLSIGLFLPYQFTLSRQPIVFGAGIKDDAGALFGIPELTGVSGSGNNICIPYDGAEFPIDVTISHKSSGKREGIYLYPAVSSVYISMINAPTILNTDVLKAAFFVKVIHTLPMVTD